jgi:uncharacterized protein
MATIDTLVKDFLAQGRIAVAGVSNERDTPANLIYRKLKARGTAVVPVNPKIDTFDGDRCFPSVDVLPERPDGVFIGTGPAASEEVVRQCVAAGVKRVWMHNMLGTRPRFMKKASDSMTSVSPEAVRLCRENGIAVIPGSCPMQFIGDPGHKCMRGILRWTGALEIPA